MIAFVSIDHEVQLWHRGTGILPITFIESDRTMSLASADYDRYIYLRGLTFSPDGKMIAAIDQMQTASGVTVLIGLSIGKRTIDADTALILIEIPEALDWWSILEHNGLLESMIGVVLVVDSSRPENFRQARAILGTQVAYYQAPCIIAANRQDRPEAWPIDDLKLALKHRETLDYEGWAACLFMPYNVTDPESVNNLLRTLLEVIATNALVTKAIANLKDKSTG